MMSFELPSSLERDIQRYADAEHISTTEAVVKLIKDGLKVRKHTTETTKPITDAELSQFETAFPTLRLLDDVTDEQWNRILKKKQRLSKEGFPSRA